ncbi:MAG TPA: hypothetical protein VF534_23690, partial [Paraburkholderia sp.]
PVPDPAPSTSVLLAEAPPSAAAQQSVRAARIESAAARIASRQGRQDVAKADTSSHTADR